MPETGPYSIVNEGGGRGLVWAYEDITPEYNVSDKETIRGIYESVVSSDKKRIRNCRKFRSDSECSALSDAYD